MDVIVAPSTPPGRGAVAMVRLSGQGARPLAASLCPGGPDWHPRRASLRTVAAGALSDRAVVVWMR